MTEAEGYIRRWDSGGYQPNRRPAVGGYHEDGCRKTSPLKNLINPI
jgi:hypothetical protein